MFNQNSNQWLAYLCYYGPATMGGWAQWSPHFFLQQKEKKETGKNKVFHNRNISKQKYFKTIQNVTVLTILECLEFKNFYCCPTTLITKNFQCFMTPRLWHPFCQPCVLSIELIRVFDCFNILELLFVQNKL